MEYRRPKTENQISNTEDQRPTPMTKEGPKTEIQRPSNHETETEGWRPNPNTKDLVTRNDWKPKNKKKNKNQGRGPKSDRKQRPTKDAKYLKAEDVLTEIK